MRPSQQYKQPKGKRKNEGQAGNPKKQKGAVDLRDLNLEKKNEEIDNCLELLIITLCKTLNLKPKQV